MERDGKDYYYLTPELFKLRIDRGDFLSGRKFTKINFTAPCTARWNAFGAKATT